MYDVLHAATRYKIDEVTEKCSLFLQNSVCVKNVCNVLNGSIKFRDEALTEKCLNVISDNGEEVMKQDSFTALTRDALMKVAQREFIKRKSEISIYQACIKWAEAECRRTGKDVTDDNKRYVLGDVLYQIRFHQMAITEFSDLTRSSSLLTAEEKVEMYEAIVDRERGREHQRSSQFNMDQRSVVSDQRSSQFNMDQRSFDVVVTANRFQEVSGRWSCSGGYPNAITFSTDKAVIMEGVGLYGGVSAGSHNVQVMLLDERDKVLADTGNITMHSDGSTTPVPVKFSSGVAINANSKYTVKAIIKGGYTHYGTSGKSSVVVNDVTFTFTSSSHSKTNTNVSGGQIACLVCRV